MPTTTPAPPALARPIVPRPLWERHALFQEPAYPEGIGPADDDDLEDED